MERNRTADNIKAYACLLVLIGHVFSGIRTSGITVPSFMPTVESFIWTFHIDLFMMISGFVYTLTGRFTGKGSRIKFLTGKLINLGIPYSVFSVLYITVNSVIPGVNNKSHISDIIKIFYEPVAQYWFLYALFFLFVIWTVLSLFLKNEVITLITFGLLIISKIFGFSYGFLDSTFNCALAFGIGTCLESLDFKKIPNWLKISTIPVHIAAVVTMILTGVIKFIIADDVATILGLFASVFFVGFIQRISFVDRFLNFICKYSFPIYLLHTFFTSATRIILLRFGYTNYILHVVAGTFAGLSIPLLIAWICSIVPIFNIVFYPKSTIKKLSSKTTAQ